VRVRVWYTRNRMSSLSVFLDLAEFSWCVESEATLEEWFRNLGGLLGREYEEEGWLVFGQ